MRVRVVRMWPILAVALATTVTACSKAKLDPLLLVPSDVHAVAIVDWTAVKSSDQLRNLLPSDRFTQDFSRPGLNENAVLDVVAFYRQVSTFSSDHATILRSSMRANGSGAGRPVNQTPVQQPDGSFVVHPRMDVIVFWTQKAVEDVVGMVQRRGRRTLRDNRLATRPLEATG